MHAHTILGKYVNTHTHTILGKYVKPKLSLVLKGVLLRSNALMKIPYSLLSFLLLCCFRSSKELDAAQGSGDKKQITCQHLRQK